MSDTWYSRTTHDPGGSPLYCPAIPALPSLLSLPFLPSLPTFAQVVSASSATALHLNLNHRSITTWTRVDAAPTSSQSRRACLRGASNDMSLVNTATMKVDIPDATIIAKM